MLFLAGNAGHAMLLGENLAALWKTDANSQ
jgi:hypothetical protein